MTIDSLVDKSAQSEPLPCCLGLAYALGVTSSVVVWPPGVEPLPPEPYSGSPPVTSRLTKQRQPMSVKALALSRPPQSFQSIS
jgi:SRSO17 transposase